MLGDHPSSRLGSRLLIFRSPLSCAPRCAPISNPLLPQRRLHSSNPQPISSALSTVHKHRFLGPTATEPTHPYALRCASTTTTSPLPTTGPAPNNPTLTWNDYLALRKVRRRYNLAGSFVTSLATTTIGISILQQQNFEQLGGLFGLDPFIVLGLATAGSGAVGWLLGPFVGGGFFGVVYRRVGGEMREKEKDFYRRIKRYRVDPSSQSFSNPVPDYYGEKIGSVSEFRNWMKDQRAYNKKRQSFL